MRLRTFNGPSMSEVMADVRRTLGPDAVIITTADLPNGSVEVRAAADRGAVTPSKQSSEDALAIQQRERAKMRGDRAEGLNRIARALTWHQVTDEAAEALMEAAMTLEDGEATATLARAIDQRYSVHPAEMDHARPLMIVGPPGSGKSSVLAKLAARAVSAGQVPYILSSDDRAGASDQMQAFAKALDCPFQSVSGPAELETVMSQLPAGPVLIDTSGINPFELDELDALAELANRADAEMVAVIEAGIVAEDGEDIAAMFASIGTGRVIATKLDTARRLGAVLSFGEAGLAYAHISASPYIGSGLAPATALRLARALLEENRWEEVSR